MAESREEYLKRRKANYQKNKIKIANQNRKRYLANKELFRQRKLDYIENNKEKYIQSYRSYSLKNKETIAIKSKIKRTQNIEEYNKRQRELRENRTPEQKKRDAEYKKQYRLKNKDKLYEYQKNRRENNRHIRREYHKTRYRTDIQYKIQHNLRSRMKNIGKFKVKDSTCLNLLGCSIDYFKEYFYNLFTDGMSWDLFMSGEIHIDHIKPCAKFDLTNEDEQRKCFHYTNLQPLWKIDNLRKHAKYDELKTAQYGRE